MAIKQFIAASALCFMTAASHAAGIMEPENKDLTLQLLGSGGPISDDLRASSGELIWYKGKSRVLIDAGGGVYLRFGEAGAKLEDLDFFGISHFHTDHSADVPAILKGGVFFNREKELVMSGPTKSDTFLGLNDYMAALFNPEQGAYKYLSGVYDGTNQMFPVKMQEVDYSSHKATKVFEEDGLTVYAQGIPHGDVPNLSYRIESPEGVIVISADNNGTNDDFIEFAQGADILVMPIALDENADEISRQLHMVPSDVGRIAAAINPRQLVLNHFMGRSLKMKDFSVAIVKKAYHGPVYAGRDLSSFSVTP